MSRNTTERTYTHIAFTIEESDFELLISRLTALDVTLLPGRERHEQDKRSIYFLDPDGHMFEFHTGSLHDRLQYYRAEKEHMIFYEQSDKKK